MLLISFLLSSMIKKLVFCAFNIFKSNELICMMLLETGYYNRLRFFMIFVVFLQRFFDLFNRLLDFDHIQSIFGFF